MTVDPNALFLQIDSVYNANSLGLMARDMIGEGVTTAGGMAVTQRASGGANMSVDVAAGVAWVEGDEDATQPTYRVMNTSTTNVPIGSAHASLDRIDLVVVQVADSQFSGSADEAAVVAVAGTPASSPSPPAVPDNALPLAMVAVGAQVTQILDDDITDLRQPWSPDKARTGELVAMYMSQAPWGYLVCDGSEIDAARYPRLVAAIGGTTLPDWRGRALIGAGQGAGLTARTVGQMLGGETLPAHTHDKGTLATSAAGGHDHLYRSGVGINVLGVASGTGNGARWDIEQVRWTDPVADHTHTITGSTGSTGTGSHGVMQPSLVALPCIRA